MLKESSFVKEVIEAWLDLPAAAHLLSKLTKISSYMARWGRTFFHKYLEKVKHQKAIINLIDHVDETGVKEYLQAQGNLNELSLHEDLY